MMLGYRLRKSNARTSRKSPGTDSSTMLGREPIEAPGRGLERGDPVEDDSPRHARDRGSLRSRPGQDPRGLPSPADRERQAMRAAPSLDDGEIELDDVPAAENIGI